MNPTKQTTEALITWAKCKRYSYRAPKNNFPLTRAGAMPRARFYLWIAFRFPTTHPNK